MIGQITEFIGKATQVRALRGWKVELEVDLQDPKFPADVLMIDVRFQENAINIKERDSGLELINLRFDDSTLKLSVTEGDEEEILDY